MYPGFDPMKMYSEERKVKEIKNGRLAMVVRNPARSLSLCMNETTFDSTVPKCVIA